MNKKDNKDNDTQPLQHYYYPPSVYTQDDEINLMDLLRILAARKLQIIATFLVIIVLGCAYAFLKKDVYNYSTAIQMGTIVENGKEHEIDDVKNAESKLKEIYIPSVLSDFYKQNPDKPKSIKIDVTVPKESHLIILNSKSSVEESSIYQDLITKVSNELIDNYNKIIKAYTTVLMEEITNAKNRFQVLLENERNVIKRIEEFDKTFKATPIDNSGTTALVITELSNQKQQIENQKYALESLITQKQSTLNLIKESKRLMPVTQSIETTGADKKLIITMAVFLGFFLAILFALLSDFIEKIKIQIAMPK